MKIKVNVGKGEGVEIQKRNLRGNEKRKKCEGKTRKGRILNRRETTNET